MATERKFKTEILSEEDIAERRENETSKAIDIFRVDSLKSSLGLWTRLKEVAEENPDDINIEQVERYQKNIDECRDASFDKFLHITKHIPYERLRLFWSVFMGSNNSFLSEEVKVLEKETEGADPVDRIIKIWDYLQNSLKDKTIPIDAWTSLLTEYKEVLESYNNSLQELAPRIRERVKRQFITHINSDLEVPKSEEEIDEILNAYNFRIIDPLAVVSHIGAHRGPDGLIYLELNELLSEEGGLGSMRAQHLIAHEMLHALSAGQAVEHSLDHIYDDGFIMGGNVSRNQWVGLSTGGFKVSRLTWLNEAVTETLSAKMVEGKPTSYSKEIELMNLLLTKGKKTIDFKLLVNAYFEKKGYEAEEDVDDEHKFWRKLRQEIRDSYDHDPQFLIRLDDAIKENGIAAVIDFMKKMGSK